MPKVAEYLLLHSPGFVKDIMVSCYGMIENYKRHGAHFYERYKTLSAVRKNGAAAILELQEESLRALLTEASMHSSWYRSIFNHCQIRKEELSQASPFELLARLPLLEKNTLRSHVQEIQSENPGRKTFVKINTSGTTGSPMQIAFDVEARQSTYAEWRVYHDWLGLPKRFRSVRLSGRIFVDPAADTPPFWAYNRVEQQLFMSTYHLKDEYIPHYIAKLNSFKPELIDGYPSAIYIIAQHILRSGRKLNFVPLAISSTAETLMDHQRHAIEQAFGCKVYNQYASSEGSPWVVECKNGQYHLWLETGVFEFINAQPMDEETEIAELVVTSFRNFKTPLIRYRIGDYVQIYKNQRRCGCGSALPVIKAIIGRNDDILFTEEKGLVGRLDPVYKGVQGISQSRIIQHSVEKLEVLLVANERFDSNERNILHRNLRDRLGQEIKIEINLVDSIPYGKTGKLRSVERRFPLTSLPGSNASLYTG